MEKLRKNEGFNKEEGVNSVDWSWPRRKTEETRLGISVVIDGWEVREQKLWDLFFQRIRSCLVVKR